MAIKDLFTKQPHLGMNLEDQRDNTEEDVLMPAVTGTFYILPTRKPHKTCISDDTWESFTGILKNLITKVSTSDIEIQETSGTYGFNGTNTSSAPTTVDHTKEISLTAIENNYKQCTKVIREWVYSIRNPISGLSRVIPYTLKNMTFDAYIIFTKPMVGEDPANLTVEDFRKEIVNEVFFYKYLRPKKIPFSAVSIGDKEASDKIDFEMPLSYRERFDATDNTEPLFIAGSSALHDYLVFEKNRMKYYEFPESDKSIVS